MDHLLQPDCEVFIAPQRKSRITDFPGIVAAAKQLDCSRIHLWYVLTGRRQSKSLHARYKELSTSRNSTKT